MEIKETSCSKCANIDGVVNRHIDWRGICRKVVSAHGQHDAHKFMQGDGFSLLAHAQAMWVGPDCSCDQFLSTQDALVTQEDAVRLEMRRLRKENADIRAEYDRLVLLTATKKAEISVLAVDEIREDGWYWAQVSSCKNDWEIVYICAPIGTNLILVERMGRNDGWQPMENYKQSRFIGPIPMPENAQ